LIRTLQERPNRETNRLLILASAGDRDAGGELFIGHAPALYRAALRVLGTHADAEDAVQNGLLAAWRNLKRFEGRSQFSTWLTRIVVNEALQQIRRNRAHSVTSLDAESNEYNSEPLASYSSDPGPNPEQTYARQEMVATLRDKLHGLPELYRSVLQLRDVEGMSTRRASKISGASQGTLKSRLYRGRQMLLRGDLTRGHRWHTNPYGRPHNVNITQDDRDHQCP
jgi:RNA polymerase sigma-70 factor (ECF subfamily)